MGEISRFMRNEEASVSVEAALIVPLAFFAMWFGSEASRHYRLENALHRATATLADILANQKVGEDQELTDLLADGAPMALVILADMLEAAPGEALEGEILPGLIVTYFDTMATDQDNNPVPPVYWQLGSVCARDEPLDLQLLSQSLITGDNVAQAKLVMVEACAYSQTPRSVGQLMFPSQLSSFFIAPVKD
jgi:hypothetical protein